MSPEQQFKLLSDRLDKIADPTQKAAVTVRTPAPRLGDNRLPVVSTTLARDYRGGTIFVTVLDKDFVYDGQVYKTLTAVAKAATGTHWNGYQFFGLVKPKKDDAQ